MTDPKRPDHCMSRYVRIVRHDCDRPHGHRDLHRCACGVQWLTEGGGYVINAQAIADARALRRRES